MNHELAKTLTTALVQFIDREQPKDKMCVSSIEAEELERCFTEEKFNPVEDWCAHRMKSELTEFEEELVNFYNERCMLPSDKDGTFNRHDCYELLHESAKKLLALAKKELLSYHDESNPAIEAMVDLERTFECNPDKLPIWLKDELTKKHLEGYIMGRNDALREMSDFIESHFNGEKARTGTQVVTHMDNCNTQKFVSDEELAASSGTSTLKAEG